LKRVDLPALGGPTIPIWRDMLTPAFCYLIVRGYNHTTVRGVAQPG
jgi:hypothetical protein